MRQVGVLAAAGLVALETMTSRLHEDHANAQVLARGLAGIQGIKIDPERVQTNILVFDVAGCGHDPAVLVTELKRRAVIAEP